MKKHSGEELVAAFEDGFQNWIDGYPITTNPYFKYSDIWDSWCRGWNTAKYGSGIKKA